MSHFPEGVRFAAGDYVADFVQWLTTNYAGFFDAIKEGILWFILHMENFLLWLPWWLVLLVVFLFSWRIRNFTSGIVFAAMLFVIGTFNLWTELMYTVAIVVSSVVIALLIGIPLGILMAYNRRFDVFMKPILDAMQTMPSFVYLIPAMMLFSLGKVPAVFATIIYAIPPVIRLTSLGIQGVSKEMVEAGKSFGPSSWQLLSKVQLPQALPSIMTGVNQTTMMALAMVVIASMVGAKGLGYQVLVGINRVDIAIGFEAGLSIVFLAIIIDRLTQSIVSRFKYPD